MDSKELSTDEIHNLVSYCKTSPAEEMNQSPQHWLTIADHLILAEEGVDAEVLDLLAVKMYKSKNFEKGFEISKRLRSLFPFEPRGSFRLGAYFSYKGKSSSAGGPDYAWKLAMMFYGEALKSALELESHSAFSSSQKLSFLGKLSTQALQAILSCARYTEFDCIATELEIASLPEEFWPLMVPWTPRIREAVLGAFTERGEPDISTIFSLHSRERMSFYSPNHKQFCKLPRFFRWITPFRMAVMSTPRNAEDIKMLVALGIQNVVTLTKEEPLLKEWFSESITNTFMPVSNYKAPTIAQVDNFFNLFETEQGATLVHCGGGKGRAGTFIACYLARYGFTGIPGTHPRYGSSSEIINIVRKMRPGSIETEEQERFVSTFVKELWKRAESGGKLVLLPEPEPEDSSNVQLQVDGDFEPHSCKLIVCCGIPGSGKSSVAHALEQRGGWVVASQDETGSRDACGKVVSRAVQQGKSVIVDRCNPTVADRTDWIEMAGLPRNRVLCLFFDYQEDLCLQRANQRFDHPTLEAGRARNAVRSMQKSLQRPSLVEKFGSIVTVRSIAESNMFVEKMVACCKSGCEKKMASSSSLSQRDEKLAKFHKFPRTRHLMNFGSATRDDLVMTSDEANAFLCSDGEGVSPMIVTFEEKVDGANLGFSINPDTGQIRAQNRSHFVTSKSHQQFKKLDMWISNHREDLLTVLAPVLAPQEEEGCSTSGRYILFGEWLQATHSIRYTHLPDYFLAFDIYDMVEDKFWSRERFGRVMKQTCIRCVPRIPVDEISEDMFQQLVNRASSFYDGPLEGIYIRRDLGPFLLDRAKVVRKNFIAGNTHWTKQIVTDNVVRWDSQDGNA